MYEYIAASIIWSDEAEPFGCIEPLDLALDTLTPVMKIQSRNTQRILGNLLNPTR